MKRKAATGSPSGSRDIGLSFFKEDSKEIYPRITDFERSIRMTVACGHVGSLERVQQLALKPAPRARKGGAHRCHRRAKEQLNLRRNLTESDQESRVARSCVKLMDRAVVVLLANGKPSRSTT